MNTRTNIATLATGFRRRAGVLLLLILFTSLFPTHASAGVTVHDRGGVGTEVLQIAADSRTNLLDGMSGHLVSQCSCSISVLPQCNPQIVSRLERPIRFAMTQQPFMPFGAQAPPSEPPRH